MPPLHRLRRARGPVAAVVAAAALVACANPKHGSAAVPPEQAAAVVHLKATSFVPSSVTIDVGQTVTWVWDDPIIHNIVGDGFGTGNLVSGTYSHEFPAAGTFPYRCTIHAAMTGTVVVQPNPEGGPTPSR